MVEAPVLRHSKQVAALNDQARFSYWLAGRRGGKTVGVREYLLEPLPAAPKGAEIYYIGPTNAHAMELMWEAMEERLLELGWGFKPRVSRQRFELSRRRKIYIIGGEKIQRVRGKKILRAAVDELAYFKTPIKKIWQALRPALSDLKGGCRFGTTPNGRGSDAHDWWLKVKADPQWSTHQWLTLDNPYIDPAEIEAAKRDLDELSFKQEYLATWETFGALAYYSFDENLHVHKQPPIDDGKPVVLSFDFNVNPTTMLISQTEQLKNRPMVRVKKEYSLNNSSTEQTVEKFCTEHKDKVGKWFLKIRGDATGANRSSTTGFSDYYYIEEILKNKGFKIKKEVWSVNPPVVDRVKHANSWLKNVYGEHRVEIDPMCVHLIKDLSSQKLDGRMPDDANNLGHKADAFGYNIYYEHKLSKQSGDQSGMI